MASKTVRTMCPMNCHPTLCGMQVTVRDGKLEDISGDPDNPDSQGYLCLRGKAAHEIIDNPQRILTPLQRKQRGSPDWEPTSWQAVLDQITGQLDQIPAEQFGLWLGHGDLATNYGTRLGSILSRRFAHLYGCQWWHPAMICWGLGGFGFGLTGVLDVHTKEDMSAHSDLIILWGANVVSQPNTAPHLKAAQARGAKIITIDIRKTEAAALADEFYLIKPGSDAALALAMLHIIVQQDWIDREFIDQYSIGFEQMAPELEQYTPEWATGYTGLSADQIFSLAKQYAGIKQAMILIGGSSMHKYKYGWQAPRAIACLPALTGKLGIPGAGLGPRHGATASGQLLNSLLPESANRCKAVIPNQMSAMTTAFNDGSIRALLLSGTDMASSFADTNQLEQGLQKLDLIVSHDLFMNDTMQRHADIVLPATAWLEQIGCKSTNTHLYFMEQALAPAGEARTLSQILQALAQRLDIKDFFPWASDEDMINAVIDHPSTNHASVEQMRKEDNRRALNISHVAYTDKKFHTPSGKIEFYSERAVQHGLPGLPAYTPVNTETEYPLRFRQGRT
ncbi:MAG: molybdopterin-dependent oxidoreductase, partial [Thiotrichales bacterium]|nr:molybdopterin-dependent oxidoreductase [Thiotrichales bacterium]